LFLPYGFVHSLSSFSVLFNPQDSLPIQAAGTDQEKSIDHRNTLAEAERHGMATCRFASSSAAGEQVSASEPASLQSAGTKNTASAREDLHDESKRDTVLEVQKSYRDISAMGSGTPGSPNTSNGQILCASQASP
jgi:hypothetical protein